MAVPLLRAAVLSVVSVGICLSERRIVLFPSLFPTDRQFFCLKLCLSVPFPGFQPPFWAPSGREMPQTLPDGLVSGLSSPVLDFDRC